MGREFTAPPSDTSELLVLARLVDKQVCPSSGERHYGLVMKYAIVEVLSGYYNGGLFLIFPSFVARSLLSSGDSIYVCHGAPELPRLSYFKVSNISPLLCKAFANFVVASIVVLFVRLMWETRIASV